MFNYRKNIILLAAALGLMASTAVMADDDDGPKMRAIAETAGLISIEQASEKALAAKPGTITEAELDKRHWPEGWDYEFEIVDKDGKEWDVDIDAKTGEVRKAAQDWF
jgi:uncharacterized membrane protein YkoI